MHTAVGLNILGNLKQKLEILTNIDSALSAPVPLWYQPVNKCSPYKDRSHKRQGSAPREKLEVAIDQDDQLLLLIFKLYIPEKLVLPC